MNLESLPAWAAWIEMITRFFTPPPDAESLPAWAAWIEISRLTAFARSMPVAARMGSVD